jgi:alpha-L-fucosidase
MTFTRSDLIATGAALTASPALAAAKGPFQPTWESLAAGYKVPDWFRDAKLGIWSHWGPQCVPEFGDWYGRQMYQQGNRVYEHHLKTYGHPADFGFMQFIPRWKAQNWDPEDLMKKYVAAGAKYFMSMANHHDNLDMYDSRHHAWNTTRVGPRRDIVGTWAKVARAHGLRFGVSNHSAHAWHWWQTAYGYDAEGPRRGQRYDAFGLTKAGGKGQWWQGLDPQDLYTGGNMVIPDGIDSIKAANAWHDSHDGDWIETPPPNNPGFVRNWLLRQNDLVDRYRPDLVYFDNYTLPLDQAGLSGTGSGSTTVDWLAIDRRLDAQLLLGLQRLQLGAFLGQVGVDQVAHAGVEAVLQLADEGQVGVQAGRAGAQRGQLVGRRAQGLARRCRSSSWRPRRRERRRGRQTDTRPATGSWR